MNIKDFINKILSEKNNKAESYSLGKLTKQEIEMSSIPKCCDK